MSFLGGLNIKQFLSEHTEWHALVEGVCSGFLIIFPWVNRHKATDKLVDEIKGEHHYYIVGAVIGVLAFVFFCIGIYKWVT